jgi:hypothetical protein
MAPTTSSSFRTRSTNSHDSAQNAGDEADDDRGHRVDEAAGRGDGDETREEAVAGHRRIRLP